MASLTIRDLDEDVKQNLRIRAAHHQHSMGEEARQILRAALLNAAPAISVDLGLRIRARFAGLGGIDLPVADREAVRSPPPFCELDGTDGSDGSQVSDGPDGPAKPLNPATGKRTRRSKAAQ